MPYTSTFLMTKSGMGYGVNAHRLTFFPVARLRNLYVPFRFPVGPSMITGVERVAMVFVFAGSSWTSQYVPNGDLQCFAKSSLCR